MYVCMYVYICVCVCVYTHVYESFNTTMFQHMTLQSQVPAWHTNLKNVCYKIHIHRFSVILGRRRDGKGGGGGGGPSQDLASASQNLLAKWK